MSVRAVGHSYFDVQTGTQLDAWYPESSIDPKRSCLAEQLGLIEGRLVEITIDDLGAPATDLADAYLRLHVLSRRATSSRGQPGRSVQAFDQLRWHGAPVLPDRVDELQSSATDKGIGISVTSVDSSPE